MADRFRNLVASARDIIAAVDTAGCLTYVSPAIQQTLGLLPTEVVGNILWELVHPDDVEAVYEALKEIFEEGERKSIEFQMLDVVGRWRRLDASVQLMEDGGELVEAVLTATDVTERRRTEAALRERDEELRQVRKLELVGRLAGGISHDFGNLLTIIIGASGRMLDGLPAESPLRAHAESIEVTAARAAAIVRQLLAFTRPHADVVTAIDLNEVTREAEQILRRLLGEDITLCTTCAADLWPVRADRTQIEQILLNLAVNARDAMPGGGQLTIETRNVPHELALTYDASLRGAYVAVSVTDSGIGMDSDTQARAFEPFFTTKEAGKGTGLGLATVDSIVKESGGWTQLVSAPGRGTSVVFALPRAHDTAVARHEKPAAVRGGDETLLLVEDEPGVRELVRDMLDMAGYRVLEAAMPSAAEQINSDFADTIHMLVTDVVMPEMSGLELSARLRARRPALRVMYMSGFPEPAGGDGAVEAPGAHFIAKPFDRRALLQCVRRALDADGDS